MDVGGPQVPVRMSTSFLLLLLLQTSTRAQLICYAPETVDIEENNAVDEVVAVITVEAGVTVNFKTPPTNPDYPFMLNGNQLIVTKALDYEAETTYEVELTCRQESPVTTLDLVIIIVVINMNDNPPRFVDDPCRLEVRELSAVDTLIGSCPATDADPNTRLFYTLSPETEGVKLQSPTSPNILVQTRLDYDKVKNLSLTLHVQDSPLPPDEVKPFFTATATLLVNITDVDNRPPWFQPCTKYTVGEDVICHNMGYTGRVTINELQVGALPLTPGPLYAIDGDAAINEEIKYEILNGSDVFQINSDSGNISMLRAADSLTSITLTVVASQKRNSFQLATSTVTFNVLEKSLHPPRFEKPQYNGTVSAVGTVVMDLNNEDRPLQILAKDQDYIATEGVNPDIRYRINGNSDFLLVSGFLFMIKNLSATTLNLQVEAVDTTNDESATCEVTVEVRTGLSTTSEAPSTTTPTAATNTSSSMTTDITSSTSEPSTTPEGVTSTASTADAHTDGVLPPAGAFGSEDMLALGATLGVLLFVCLLVIGLLVCRVQRGKADWMKVYEANVFRSSLGQSGRKEGIQFTNEAFQKDEDDAGTSGSGGPEKWTRTAGETQTRDVPINNAIMQSAEPSHSDSSQDGTEKTDHEKEVKPILTKERRMEDGYKAVWFKEDIDPDAKEEVVIIPDSRDEEEEEERSFSGREEDEDDGSQMKIPKVGFADTDLDSGLGVKMDDPADDSEEDNVLTADL